MTKRDFITVEDWVADEVDRLLALAARVKRGEVLGGLERKVLAMVFMDPSLRTRTSVETAMFLHGGHAVVLEPGETMLLSPATQRPPSPRPTTWCQPSTASQGPRL